MNFPISRKDSKGWKIWLKTYGGAGIRAPECFSRCWTASGGRKAGIIMVKMGGWASDASDKAMRTFTRLIREKEGLQMLPASTAGLIALMNKHAKEPLPPDRYVVVLTGRKS
jgi:threonine synthase